MPKDVLLSLLMLIALVAALPMASALVGLGSCRDCNDRCAPWDAYCGEHRP